MISFFLIFFFFFAFFTVPRKFGLPLVFIGMFGLGIPSALHLNFLINQVRSRH